MRKLNLGCGTDIRPGWVNVDAVPLPGVDIVHDLTILPLPFGDGSCSEIVCQDVLEHLDYIPLLRDIHRVLNNGGTLIVRVPHFTSRDSFGDPTHRKMFSIETLQFFEHGHTRDYYFDFSFSRVEVSLKFARRLTHVWNFVVEPLVNLNRRSLNFYECSPLRMFPATNVEALMTK